MDALPAMLVLLVRVEHATTKTLPIKTEYCVCFFAVSLISRPLPMHCVPARARGSLACALMLVVAVSAGGGGAGNQEISLEHNGVTRHATLHVPPRPLEAAPIVINYHALASNPATQAALTGMNTLADQEGFVVVYPRGQYGAKVWTPLPAPGPTYSLNAGGCCPEANSKKADDVGFTKRLIEYIVANVSAKVDLKRVYATGMSNGGFMTNRLGCEASEMVAAIAPVSGPMMNWASPAWDSDEFACALKPNRSMPTLHIHGLADLVVPFKGSKLLGFPAIPDSVSGWRERNKCMQAEPTQSFNNGSVSCDTWCSGVQNVTLCSVRGGGHSWPGATAALCPSSGPFACSRDMDATREIWAFFKRYSL